jgi:hypothetical protein
LKIRGRDKKVFNSSPLLRGRLGGGKKPNNPILTFPLKIRGRNKKVFNSSPCQGGGWEGVKNLTTPS